MGEEEGSSEPITIKVKDASGEEMQFKVKKTTRMEKIFEAYAGRKGIAASSLRFMLDGTKITGEHTPKMLELEDNDQIDVLLEQVGGGRLTV